MKQKTPQHVAIVMDGNGRWAEAQGLPRIEGHRVGVEAIRGIVKVCPQKNVSTLSIFAFGQENWARPVEEVNFLMDLFLQSLEREIAELHQEGVCLRFIGEREKLAPELQERIRTSERLTEDNQTLHLNIAMNYSGSWDILEATRRLIRGVQAGELSVHHINDATFSEALSTAGLAAPDLFIRTSGERRISNFFLWQLAYSELYFTDVAWPDFTPEEFDKAIDWFASRERRYGKISKQLSEE